VVDDYLDILVNFRQKMHLPPLADPNEATPLIPDLHQKSSITVNRISQIIKWDFTLGANLFEEQSKFVEKDIQLNYQYKAANLKKHLLTG